MTQFKKKHCEHCHDEFYTSEPTLFCVECQSALTAYGNLTYRDMYMQLQESGAFDPGPSIWRRLQFWR